MFGRSDRIVLGIVVLTLLGTSVYAERLKDLATVQGVRNNQLVGYGLVVGLSQTGDDYNVPFTQQSVLALLRRMGTLATDPQLLRTRDTAAVLVTALVPPFSKSGTQIDVNVAALGNARSLQGGVLISTPLRSSDGRVYGVAQGPVLVGGLFVTGLTGSINQRNHVTTGRIPEGAIVERDLPIGLKNETLTFLLKHPDFTTANRVALAIEKRLTPAAAPEAGPKEDPDKQGADKDDKDDKPAPPKNGADKELELARQVHVHALDAGTVEVKLPREFYGKAVAVAAQLEDIEIEPDQPARVVVNERSGVVVIGAHVRLGQAAVSYGRLTVKVDEAMWASQPGPLGRGRTAILPQTTIEQNEEKGPLRVVGPAAKIEDVVAGLNQLGASTRELVAILQALKLAGALRGELVIE